MGAEPTSAVRALGASSFEAFTALTAVHADGWGMAWRHPQDDRTHVTTSVTSAAHDPRYADLARKPLGSAGMVHLRWATDGLGVDPVNTHPFTDGSYAFAHNGAVSPIPELESMLSPRNRRHLTGDTDSERYFRFVLQCIEEFGEERDGITWAVARLHQRFPHASLNALVLSGTRLYAVHVNSAAVGPLQDLRDLFGSDEAMPAGHATAYFDMAWRQTSTAVHVVSSGLAEEGWSPIPQDCILEIQLTSRQVELLPVASAPTPQ